MKIEKLLAPKQQEIVTESDAGTSTAGSIASVAAPMGNVQRRGKGSMLKGIKTSAKFPNSQAVKEGKNSELDSLYDQYDELDYEGNSESDKEKMRHIQQKIKDLKATEKKVNEGRYNNRDAYQRDYDSSQTGFGRGRREDDEYHNPEYDPARERNRQESTMYNITVNGQPVNPKPILGRSAALAWAKQQVAAGQLDAQVARLGPVQYKEESVEEDSTGNELKTWQVVIFNNYYAGKYSDYRGRYYYVLATSPEEAKQVVIDNADGILQEILAMKSQNGKKILPRGTAVRITPERIGKIEDGTVAGRMSTAGYKKMFGPQGPMMVKLSGGAVVDMQGQEQPVDEASFDYTMKDLGNDYAGFPSNHSMKHKFLAKIKPEKQQLYKDKINNTHDWDNLFALFKVAKERGDIIEPGSDLKQPTKSMGLNASLDQHFQDKAHLLNPNQTTDEAVDYDKHSFIGKIRRGREADNKGWGQLGQLFAAGKDEKAAEKALRKGNRYYNMTRGDNKTPGGFPKTTIEEQDIDEAGGRIPSGLSWTGGQLQKRPELVAAARQKKNRDAAMKRKALKVANAVVDLVAKDAEIQSSNEPYRAAMYELGFEEMDGSTWWKMVMKAIDDINSKLPQNQELDEKSKSQAQFRTMAAVAHNPKFAKKVGISQKVGKEFHSADKGANYKSLPKKVEEDSHTPEAFQDIVQRAGGDVRGIYKELQERGLHSEIKEFCIWAKHQGIADIFEAIKLAERVGLEVDDENEIAYEGYLRASELLGLREIDEEKQRLDPKCWSGYKKQGTKMKGGVRVNNCVKVDEAEVSEDKLASDLYRDLQIFKKGADKDIGSKAKDKEIGNKPKDKDIVAKEGLGDFVKGAKRVVKGKTDPTIASAHRSNEYIKSVGTGDKETIRKAERNLDRVNKVTHGKMSEQGVEEGFGDTIKKKAKQFSKYMTEPNSPHNDQVRSRAKNIDKIRKQEEKKSVFEKDPEAMREFERSGGYEAGIDVMGWQVGWAAAKHAQGDTMKEAFQKLYYGGGASFPFSQKAFKLAWVAYNKHYGPQGNLEEMDGDGAGRDGSNRKSHSTYGSRDKHTVSDGPDIHLGSDSAMTSKDIQDHALDTLTKMLSKPENMAVLKRLKTKEDVSEDWQKTNKHDKTDGMSPKAVKAYRRENPGSKLQTAVTKKPSELKAGSKDANRRKSFCARMSGNKGPMKDEHGKPTPKAKALKRWNC